MSMEAPQRPHVEPYADDYSDGDRLEFVFTTMPLCPKCGGEKHRVDGGTRRCKADGSKTQHVTCECSHKFKIVWERESAPRIREGVGLLENEC